MKKYFWLASLLLLFGLSSTAPAARRALKSQQPIAVMDPKPNHRWDVSIWLQVNDEDMTEKLNSLSAELADKEFCWTHIKVEQLTLHGTPLIKGKPKMYVAEVPTVKQGSVWTARDGRVVVGYKRKVGYAESPDGYKNVGADKPRIKGDKLIYADATTLYIDEEGNIYY